MKFDSKLTNVVVYPLQQQQQQQQNKSKNKNKIFQVEFARTLFKLNVKQATTTTITTKKHKHYQNSN